mgnify:CR=1 FL=1
MVGGGSSHDFAQWFDGADQKILTEAGFAVTAYTGDPAARNYEPQKIEQAVKGSVPFGTVLTTRRGELMHQIPFAEAHRQAVVLEHGDRTAADLGDHGAVERGDVLERRRAGDALAADPVPGVDCDAGKDRMSTPRWSAQRSPAESGAVMDGVQVRPLRHHP